MAVVAHHAALAYNTFSHYNPMDYIRSTAPVVDTVRFAPLDILVGWNDLFFMSLMFLISGLFVAPSIMRKGVSQFLADRAIRLGIPFVLGAALVIPIAYYPSWLLSDATGGGGFLSRFFTIDGWSPGPLWFIWVLLGFCVVLAVAYQFLPNLMRGLSWSAQSGGNLVVVSLAVTLISIIPMQLLGAPEWSDLGGPLHFPTARALLYFAWFLLGVALGQANPERSLSRQSLRLWPLWLATGAASFAAYAIVSSGTYPANTPAWVPKLILATAFSFCCTLTSLAALGLARSFFRTNWSLPDHFSENAYGIYIFHYGFVTWMQFSLFGLPIPAITKFLVAFFVALMASWLLTALLRRTTARKVL